MDLSLLSSLLAPPKLDGIKKILCVQPHPDDNEIGMGGLIADFVSKGVVVDYLTVTDGSLGDVGLYSGAKDLSAVRKEECEASGRHLGVSNFLYLNYKDGTLCDIPKLSREIAEILREGGYDAVASPDPWNSYEAHFDHIVVGKATAQAGISTTLKKYPENTETNPTELKAVLFYFTSRPNTVVDTTPFFQKKMEAIALHKSQISPDMLNLYGGYFMWRGQKLTSSDKIGEGVKALLPLHLHCIPEAESI